MGKSRGPKTRPNAGFIRIVVVLAGVALCCTFPGCTGALEPANNGTATVSISIASLPGYVAVPRVASAPERAVVQGGGYLYIRMLGGPSGTGAKEYYGPYAVSGPEFITSDIPAGSYDGMFVIYAAEPVHGNTLSALDTSVEDFLALPDGQFVDSLGDFTPLDDGMNDSSSVGLTPPLVLYPRTITPVFMTLRPVTNETQPAVEGVMVGNGEEQDLRNRVFARITGLIDLFEGLDPATARLRCFVYNSDGAYPISLSAAAVYRPNGSRAPGAVASPGVLPVFEQTYFDVAWDGSDHCYVYVDFVGREAQVFCEAVVD